jgi:hypothetical protein
MVAAGVLLLLVGDGAADKKPEKPVVKQAGRSGSFVHMVTIPLKEGAEGGLADKMVADCHALLAKIPSVRTVQAGRPAEKASPDFVKRDYSVGLLVVVDDHAGLLAYLEHPLHVQFVEKYKKHIDFERLRVFDFVDGK